MTASSGLDRFDLENLAWQVLASEFAGPMYSCWPIEDRVDAFLLHDTAHDAVGGSFRDALVQRVMANIAAAHKLGVLPLDCR
ncbi:hypothetical protein [Mycolicibacterium goodii]|uniref:hypothetical protein n=1 Tax=Mycolicibacterium goodii TaxID=134601 RepID=UPI00296E71D0